jgi:pimeloyl-ACP methyl ester carboxylesterase
VIPPAGSSFAEGSAEAGGVRIPYLEAGQGRPVISLHGPGGLRWTRAHDLLAERFRVIALDVPAPGEPAAGARSPSGPDPARSVSLAAAALGLDRCSLMGAASGAALALSVAVQHADLLDALVLESPTAIPSGGDAAARARGAAGTGLEGDMATRHAGVSPERNEAAARLGSPRRHGDLEDSLSGLQVPTLVLLGTRDRVTPFETGRAYRATLPRCHLVFVYDAGHAIAADRPEAFASLVGDFLERRDQFVVNRTSGRAYP